LKKSIYIIMVVLLSIAASGCLKPDNANGNGNGGPEVLKVGDFFPMKPEAKYVYEGTGNEFASYSRWTDFIVGSKVQYRQNNGGTELVRVVDVRAGKAVVKFEHEAFFREDMTGEEELSEVVLQEPIQAGNKWSLGDTRTREITSVQVDVDTPSGKYNAIEVTTSSADDQVVDYYAKGVGLVKTEFKVSGEVLVSSSLKEIAEGSPLIQTVSLFYPNLDKERIYYREVTVSFQTNDRTGDVIAKSYRENSIDGAGRPFSANTTVNSLTLTDGEIVNIDLNRSFLTDMNAGSQYEGMILQSVVNTFGSYFGVEKAIITLDGQLYESGHFAFAKGEFWKTTIGKSIRVK